MRCEYLSNPLGIDVAAPRFAWILNHNERAEGQTAYQILVSSTLNSLNRDRGDQWDSAKAASDDSTQVVYRGKPLKSGQTYYWKVRSWDSQDHVSLYSAPAQFGMGLLSQHEWLGDWITGKQVRKAFQVEGRIARARLYVTALGYYEVHLNGKKVGENVLDPAWTDYPKRVLYSTYDITRQLQTGENAVAVTLGGGWATLGTGVLGGKPYYPQPALLLQLNIELESGKRLSVASDSSWKTASGPIVADSVYDGEVYDARLEAPGWDLPGFDDSSWSKAAVVSGSSGVLSAQMMPPIRVVDSIVPVKLLNPKPGVYVYDLGQTISGWAQLRVSGPRDTKVTLRFSETVYPDGMINTENLREAKQRDIYILRGGGEEVYEPSFTYHGFRYVEAIGFPGAPGLDSIRGRVVHTSVEAIGSFSASKPILNDIQRLIRWTQLNNLFSIPTDCNQRDEREGWMGDAQLSAEEAMMNFDMAAFYTNFVRDIHDAQAADGTLPETVPEKFGHRPADPGWGAAYPLICWYMWQQYGDRRVLEENYEDLRKYVEFLRNRAPDNVLRFNFNGDWIATVETPGEVISDAYYYYDVTVLEGIAKVLGKTADAQAYLQLAHQIKDAFNRSFFDAKTATYGGGTQTANAMALFLGLVPEEDRGNVSFYLERDLLDHHNNHLTTGIIGTKYLMPALTDTGRSDMAYHLAVQTTYPSWGYMIEHGATTIWELWQDKNRAAMNSHDHPALGSVGAWFYRALGGIDMKPDTEGYRHLRIAPQMVEDLRRASATVHTIRGAVSSAWTHSDGKTTLEITVPVGSDAEAVIPEDSQMAEITVLESGRPIWQGGKYVPGDEGVQDVRKAGHLVTVKVGSGHYSFQIVSEW
ncbi:MAG TPA: family 78 glycoside hydrolase catalytic domain [Terriglobia bacterium]|nr:family 78 glycoside hydrolase catalytic domain [Terriglobia bacterium]